MKKLNYFTIGFSLVCFVITNMVIILRLEHPQPDPFLSGLNTALAISFFWCIDIMIVLGLALEVQKEKDGNPLEQPKFEEGKTYMVLMVRTLDSRNGKFAKYLYLCRRCENPEDENGFFLFYFESKFPVKDGQAFCIKEGIPIPVSS